MKNVIVAKRQTWSDISVQETGNVYNAHAIALANRKSLTNDPTPGETIIIPDGVQMSAKELQYFRLNEIVPATGIILMPQSNNENYQLPGELPMSL